MQPLIFEQSTRTLKNGEFAEILHVQGGPVVVLSASGLASYKSVEYVSDPLGNGLMGYAEIPIEASLQVIENSFVVNIRSGFVQLHNGMALLITPFHATLFANNTDALSGQNRIAQVPMDAVDLI